MHSLNIIKRFCTITSIFDKRLINYQVYIFSLIKINLKILNNNKNFVKRKRKSYFFKEQNIPYANFQNSYERRTPASACEKDKRDMLLK